MMLDDKTECSKTARASPQSSILDFFVSPSKGKARHEEAKVAVNGAKEENSDKEIEAAKAFSDKDKFLRLDSSVDSVILLSDGVDSQSDEAGTQSDGGRPQPAGATLKVHATGSKSDRAELKPSEAGLQSDGAGFQSDGAGFQSDGATLKLDGTGSKSDKSELKPREAGLQSDGAGTQPAGATLKLDGTGSQSDRAELKPSEAGIQSDESGSQSDETGSQSDGAGTQPAGATLKLDGSGSKSDRAELKPREAGLQSDEAGSQSKEARLKTDVAGLKRDLADEPGLKLDETGSKLNRADVQTKQSKSGEEAVGISDDKILKDSKVSRNDESESVGPTSAGEEVNTKLDEVPDLKQLSLPKSTSGNETPVSENNSIETVDTKDEAATASKEAHKKTKRKRDSTDSGKRKRTKVSDEASVMADDQACPSTEMSYEAFLQYLSTPGRDAKPGDDEDTSPTKSVGADADNIELCQTEKQSICVKDSVFLLEKESNESACPNPSTNQADDSKLDENSGKRKKRRSAKSCLFQDKVEKASVPCDTDSTNASCKVEEKSKMPSILSFFSKTGSPQNSPKSEHEVVIITADVHHIPEKKNKELADNSSPLREKCHVPRVLSPKSPGVMEIDDDIEMLGTETLIPDNVKKTKKMKKNSASVSGGKVVNSSKKAQKEVVSTSADDVIEKNETTRNTEVDTFLKSGACPSVPAKSAQATLNFTKSGLKAVPKSSTPKTRVQDSKPSSKGSCLQEEDPPEKKDVLKKKKLKKKKVKVNEDVSLSNDESPAKVRPRRAKYQVSSLQFDDSRQTPIKMKIRLKKNSSGEESEFTPRSTKGGNKRQKAKKLLEKAKKVKKDKSTKAQPNKGKKKVESPNTSVIDLDSSTDGCRRRSARIASHIPTSPIVVDDEEDKKQLPEVKVKKAAKTPSKMKPKDGPSKLKAIDSPLKIKAKDSPRKLKMKDSPRKMATDSPRKKTKSSNKLAPIFMGKSKPVIETKEPEDPEKVRLRQAFLMSDLPESVKRQSAATAALVGAVECVNFPTVSHVQQRSDDANKMWNLPEVKLSFKSIEPYGTFPARWQDMMQKTAAAVTKSHIFKDFKRHMTFDHTVVEDLLKEVESGVKGLPVRQMYEDMCRKLQDDLRSQGTEKDPSEKSGDTPATDLSACLKEVTEKKKGRGRSKKKLSLTKEKEITPKEITPSPEIYSVGEMMWTVRYQPSHSAEIIGHSAHVQKLKSWLLEWKHRTHKEARKMRLQALKQSHPKSSTKDDENAWWGENDSDFDLSSDDSDDEDDGLCNTMLITGPPGIGKTATVYALAQELGYKVIEVNAASSRNGKKILSKLQEATQSHQVAQNKDGSSSNSLLSGLASLSNSATGDCGAKPAKKDVKLPSAFTNLFKKAKTSELEVIDADSDCKKKRSKQESPSKSKRKRKREKEEDKEKTPKKARKEKLKAAPLPVRDETSQSGGLELSSTTLILFDEAEIYFDDDKGYLAAVQHFMTKTKIPIILTTTDVRFPSQLQARYESLVFKQPPMLLIAGHLQTVCLAENIRTTLDEMASLVRLNRGDMRRCLLWLQYWASSGGGATRCSQGRKVTSRQLLASVDDVTNSQDSVTTSTPMSETQDDDDFINLKPVSRKKRVLTDDENSCSNVFSSQLSSDSSTSKLPQVHCLRLDALGGVSQPVRDTAEAAVLSYMQGESDEQKGCDVQELCENLHSIGLDIIPGNLFHFVQLTKTNLKELSFTCKTGKQGKPSRIRTDLFDDECSSDDNMDTEKADDNADGPAQKPDVSQADKNLSLKSLMAFSKYYDAMCSVDVIDTTLNSNSSSECYFRVKGSEDADDYVAVDNGVDCSVTSVTSGCCVSIGRVSARRLCRHVADAVSEYRGSDGERELPEEMSLPVPGGRTSFSLMTSEPRLPGMMKRAHDNILDSLPPVTQCSQRFVHLDYLPYLRCACQAEHHRQIAKTKRRFQHYFDTIGLSLKESTLNVLCQGFH